MSYIDNKLNPSETITKLDFVFQTITGVVLNKSGFIVTMVCKITQSPNGKIWDNPVYFIKGLDHEFYSVDACVDYITRIDEIYLEDKQQLK